MSPFSPFSVPPFSLFYVLKDGVIIVRSAVTPDEISGYRRQAVFCHENVRASVSFAHVILRYSYVGGFIRPGRKRSSRAHRSRNQRHEVFLLPH